MATFIKQISSLYSVATRNESSAVPKEERQTQNVQNNIWFAPHVMKRSFIKSTSSQSDLANGEFLNLLALLNSRY